MKFLLLVLCLVYEIAVLFVRIAYITVFATTWSTNGLVSASYYSLMIMQIVME